MVPVWELQFSPTVQRRAFSGVSLIHNLKLAIDVSVNGGLAISPGCTLVENE